MADEYEKNIQRVRVEIICSQALEEDFAEEFEKSKVGKHYTKISPVMGAGYSNPHLGDAVWPQLNTMYIIYCSEEEAEKRLASQFSEDYFKSHCDFVIYNNDGDNIEREIEDMLHSLGF